VKLAVSNPVIYNTTTIIFILAEVVFISIWLEERYKMFRSLGAALVGILFAMVLSNVGILAGNSNAYEILVGPIVSVGIVLISAMLGNYLLLLFLASNGAQTV